MKYFTTLALLLASICSVNANIYINWRTSGGYSYASTPDAGFLGDGSGNSAYVQLIWSFDNIIDTANEGTANFVTGDDVMLADLVYTEDGVAGNFDEYLYNTTFDSSFDDGGSQGSVGYVYARIFQDETVNGNDWYYSSALFDYTDLNPAAVPAPTPENYDMTQVGEHNYLGVNINHLDGVYGSQVQPVPEPGTMALFALGLATLGVSRRRRKVQA